jgi:hypothetical protein
MQYVLEHGIDDWNQIAKTLNLRNGQEAVHEFLKI